MQFFPKIKQDGADNIIQTYLMIDKTLLNQQNNVKQIWKFKIE